MFYCKERSCVGTLAEFQGFTTKKEFDAHNKECAHGQTRGSFFRNLLGVAVAPQILVVKEIIEPKSDPIVEELTRKVKAQEEELNKLKAQEGEFNHIYSPITYSNQIPFSSSYITHAVLNPFKVKM